MSFADIGCTDLLSGKGLENPARGFANVVDNQCLALNGHFNVHFSRPLKFHEKWSIGNWAKFTVQEIR